MLGMGRQTLRSCIATTALEESLKSNLIRQILEKLHSVEFTLAAIGLVLTNVLMFVQVLNRYWLRLPMVGLGDLTLYFFIMFMSVGAAVATWSETHVAVDAFRDRFLTKRPMGLTAHHMAMALLAILTYVFLLPQVVSFMANAASFPRWATLVTWFNLSWLQIVWGFCMFLVLIHLVEVAVKHGTKLRDMKKAGQEEI